jgi:hypothetical protein
VFVGASSKNELDFFHSGVDFAEKQFDILLNSFQEEDPKKEYGALATPLQKLFHLQLKHIHEQLRIECQTLERRNVRASHEVFPLLITTYDLLQSNSLKILMLLTLGAPNSKRGRPKWEGPTENDS